MKVECPSGSTDQQRQSTGQKIKHWPQPAVSPCPLFIHRRTPDGSGAAPFT